MDEEMKYLHLNFSPIFVERLRAYAARHGMKLNAVLKKAFEYLEDHQQTVLRSEVGTKRAAMPDVGGSVLQSGDWSPPGSEKVDGWEP